MPHTEMLRNSPSIAARAPRTRPQPAAEVCSVPVKDATVFRIKGWIERLIAAFMLIPGIPMILLLVMAIRLTSRGPGVYRQVRVGKGGRIFTMYKLRSMRIDAEAATGATWAGVAKDSRVTPLGYWLRRLHLDELPQLFNVLKGEMSLVGPRPERPEFVKVLALQIDGYLDRLKVLPGITGLAQVNLPPDTDLDSVRRKIVLDCQYIETASLGLDFRLIVCTILRCVGLRGGRAVSMLGLARSVNLPENAQPIGGTSGGPTPISVVAQSQPSIHHDDAPHSSTVEPELSYQQALRETVTFASLPTVKDPSSESSRRIKAK